MARKRTIEEVEKLQDLDKPLKNASVHGIVTSLSPIKKGRTCSYFDGTLTDSSDKIRFVGFGGSQQRIMSDYKERSLTINLDDCEVKPARRGSKMEIMLKGSTTLTNSPKKFDIPPAELQDKGPLKITLDCLSSVNVYERVTVDIKVICVSDPVTVAEKNKQDVTVADQSSSVTVTLWEDSVNSLKQHKSYRLNNFVVREYASVKYLSIARSDCTIEDISDIGEVKDTQDPKEDLTEINHVRIVGVPQLDKYKACLRCKGRVEPCSPPPGRCSKLECSMLQHYDICTEVLSAKLLFLHNSKFITLMALGPILKQMTTEDLNDEDLLKLPPMNIKYNEKTTAITSVSFSR